MPTASPTVWGSPWRIGSRSEFSLFRLRLELVDTADEESLPLRHPARHSDQRQGIGCALIYNGLAEMKAIGIHPARVVTDAATAFCQRVGCEEVGTLRWWARI